MTNQTDYGLVRVTHYLPTLQAQRYLNCCPTAGWHRNNERYLQNYPRGVSIVMVIFTVDGCGWIQLEDQRYCLERGSLVMIPANMPMRYGTEGNREEPVWEFYWLNLEGEHIRNFVGKLWQDGLAVHTCPQPEEYLSLFRSLLEDAETFRRWEKKLSDQVRRICDQVMNDCLFDQGGYREPRVDELLRYLQNHYTEDLSLETLSRHFYLSPNHLIRLFRQGTGHTPHEYLMRYRLMKAKELLQTTSIPINEIGEQLGYHNQSHFSAQFRKSFGLSPREYRRSFTML